jgi:hypothetical protein
MSNPYEGFQALVAEVPALLQPLVIAAAGMVPYIEGEGAAAFAVIAGVHPVVAALAAATGNIVCVVLIVLLGSRARTAVARFRSRRVAELPVAVGPAGLAEPVEPARPAEPKPKGRKRLERWLVRFGVPGASLLAPLALPTMLTAAAFVASGVRKEWVILWQVVAIVIWTGAVTAISTQILTVVTS